MSSLVEFDSMLTVLVLVVIVTVPPLDCIPLNSKLFPFFCANTPVVVKLVASFIVLPVKDSNKSVSNLPMTIGLKSVVKEPPLFSFIVYCVILLCIYYNYI